MLLFSTIPPLTEGGLLLIDSSYSDSKNYIYSPKHLPIMVKRNNKNEALIKFVAPASLKSKLQRLANERNITLSSFLRLISSEYILRMTK